MLSMNTPNIDSMFHHVQVADTNPITNGLNEGLGDLKLQVTKNI